MAQYDYLIVGAGLTGAVFAHEARKIGKTCLVIDRRPHIAGNVYTEEVEGINVHRYGAHIFHTSLANVWSYVNRFAEFNSDSPGQPIYSRCICAHGFHAVEVLKLQTSLMPNKIPPDFWQC